MMLPQSGTSQHFFKIDNCRFKDLYFLTVITPDLGIITKQRVKLLLLLHAWILILFPYQSHLLVEGLDGV